jgi:type IV secretory pathway VirB2 component (pilin)
VPFGEGKAVASEPVGSSLLADCRRLVAAAFASALVVGEISFVAAAAVDAEPYVVAWMVAYQEFQGPIVGTVAVEVCQVPGYYLGLLGS